MSYDENAVRRVNTAMHQNAKLQKLRAELIVYEEQNVRHARTNAAGDYLDLLKSEYRLAKILSDVLLWDTWEQRGIIEQEARSECYYDLVEGFFLDDNGEPRREGSNPPGYSDHVYETQRDAE